MPEHGEGPQAGVRQAAGGCWAPGAPCTCRRAWSAAVWDFSSEKSNVTDFSACFVFPCCTGLHQAGTCGLTGLALQLCACCVRISSLLVRANEKPGAPAKSLLLGRSRIMSRLAPGPGAGREVSRGCSLTRSSADPVKPKVVVGFQGHRGDLQSKTSTSSWDACVRKVPLLSLS